MRPVVRTSPYDPSLCAVAGLERLQLCEIVRQWLSVRIAPVQPLFLHPPHQKNATNDEKYDFLSFQKRSFAPLVGISAIKKAKVSLHFPGFPGTAFK